MELPQEIEVWYIIPAIRKALADAMTKEGSKQKDIAAMLGLAKSAVSQYISKQRGADIKFDSKITEEIRKSAKSIVSGKSCANFEIQTICKLLRKNGIVCKIHRLRDKSIKKCGVCK